MGSTAMADLGSSGPKDSTVEHASAAISADLGNKEDARQAAVTEHELSFTNAIVKYRKAVAWSAVISLATIMESYDLQLIGSFYAYPSFQKKVSGLAVDEHVFALALLHSTNLTATNC